LEKAKDFRDVLYFDKSKLAKFISAMQDEGIRIIGRGLWYISTEHTQEEIDRAIQTVDKVLAAF
jgi:glutamate-1-semialdehyde 2,1-aminomutase